MKNLKKEYINQNKYHGNFIVEIEMGITQSQLKYQTFFSGLDLIGGHGGHGDHVFKGEKSKKEEKIKNRKESKLGVTGIT